jgi:hypothetical protein
MFLTDEHRIGDHLPAIQIESERRLLGVALADVEGVDSLALHLVAVRQHAADLPGGGVAWGVHSPRCDRGGVAEGEVLEEVKAGEWGKRLLAHLSFLLG